MFMFTPREIIHESYATKATLTIRDSDYDPIAPLIADYTNPGDARIAKTDILGPRMLWPVGFSGLRVFRNTFNLRFR